MFKDNKLFLLLENSVRVSVINRDLESKILHIENYPSLRFRTSNNEWVEYKLNVVIDLPHIWKLLLERSQISLIENTILDTVCEHYNINTACTIVGLHEYIKS